MITKTTTKNKGNGYDTNLLFRMNLLRLKIEYADKFFQLFEFSINSYYIVTLPASIFTYFANDNTFTR
jgi:hypothetical protein